MAAMIPALPAEFTLADVMPSVAASLGVDVPNPLEFEPMRATVVVLIDGLGAELIRLHAHHCPTLVAHTGQMISAGFPATTATSLTSLAVGAPCTEHGIVGYSFSLGEPGAPAMFNSLRWTLGDAGGASALDVYRPGEVQILPSLLEILRDEGVAISYVMRPEFRDSGLTRAAFRADGNHLPAVSLDEVRRGILSAVRAPTSRRRFVYAYYGDLDMIGHVHGPGSEPWVESLQAVDRFVANLAEDLPKDVRLVLTADHGMVSAEHTIDLDSVVGLMDGVLAVGGEARVRHVYTEPELNDRIRGRWRTRLGAHARVVSREQAIDEGLFGIPGSRGYSDRMGDFIAIARGNTVLTRSEAEPFESTMVGHHGAATPLEQHIPLLVI